MSDSLRVLDNARPVAAARLFRLLAWALWLLIAVCVVASALFWAIGGFQTLPLSFARGTIGVAVLSLNALVFGTVGACLGARIPTNPIGWLLLATGLTFAIPIPVTLAVREGFEVARVLPATTIALAWLMSTFVTPVVSAAVILVLLVFPDGRLEPGRWGASVALAVTASAMLALATAIDPTGLLWYPVVPNPVALPRDLREALVLVRVAAVGAVVLAIAVAAGSMIVRYRRADARVQLQLRWVVVGGAVMVAGFVPFLLARYALGANETVGEMLAGIAGLAVCCLPATIAIAIVREHLFDVDAIISRTLVVVPLMGLLAGVYTASLTLFQRLFVSLTGNASDTSFVLSALILAAVFSPARSALEAQVARRFKPAAPAPARADLGEPIPLQAGRPRVEAAAQPMPMGREGLGEAGLAARLEALERLLAEMQQHAGEADCSTPRAEAAPVAAGSPGPARRSPGS